MGWRKSGKECKWNTGEREGRKFWKSRSKRILWFEHVRDPYQQKMSLFMGWNRPSLLSTLHQCYFPRVRFQPGFCISSRSWTKKPFWISVKHHHSLDIFKYYHLDIVSVSKIPGWTSLWISCSSSKDHHLVTISNRFTFSSLPLKVFSRWDPIWVHPRSLKGMIPDVVHQRALPSVRLL